MKAEQRCDFLKEDCNEIKVKKEENEMQTKMKQTSGCRKPQQSMDQFPRFDDNLKLSTKSSLKSTVLPSKSS